jgi:hypothetical protein
MAGWNGNGPVRLDRPDSPETLGFGRKKTGFREPVSL